MSLLFQLAYLGLLCVLWAAPYWPPPLWWVANLFAIAPLWVLFIPLAPAFIVGVSRKKSSALEIGLVSSAILLFGIMEFELPTAASGFPVGQAHLLLKVISINMGNVKTMDAFLELVASEKPDVIAFQEAGSQGMKRVNQSLTADGWNLGNAKNLVLASRYPIRSMDAKDRRASGGRGNIVARFELETPVGPVYVFDLHLETPRAGVEAVMHKSSGAVGEMKSVTALQIEESLLAVTYTASFQPMIVAGDFNLTSGNPLFQTYWSWLNDAFFLKGSGFGYTKHTRWHGARIDHILCDASRWQVLEARVGPDVGGDHHPVIARLALL